ncbi:MAG TPA: epoxyalkane--coenzyme M transferase, partial [Gammaproteobacteria bacterium]|nr:epoxyalkane--coenzyme M transferase [Gammaproteobacteria bacterium]
MHSSSTRILSSHIGSLPRPQHILQRIYAHQADNVPFDERYWEMVSVAVDDVVERQKAIAIDIVSDGE